MKQKVTAWILRSQDKKNACMPPAHPVEDSGAQSSRFHYLVVIPATKVSVRVLQTLLKTPHRHPTSGHEGSLALRVGHPGQVALIPYPFTSLSPPCPLTH